MLNLASQSRMSLAKTQCKTGLLLYFALLLFKYEPGINLIIIVSNFNIKAD